jgi:hypothetical protein
MNAMKNFEIAVNALYNCAPSDKARDFVEQLAEKIRAKGEDWIAEHVDDLHISDIEVADDTCFPIKE